MWTGSFYKLITFSFSSGSLRSRGSFLVVNPTEKKLYLWQGTKATEGTKERGRQAANDFKDK